MRCICVTLLLFIGLRPSAQNLSVQEDENGYAVSVKNNSDQPVEIEMHFEKGSNLAHEIEAQGSFSIPRQGCNWFKLKKNGVIEDKMYWRKSKKASPEPEEPSPKPEPSLEPEPIPTPDPVPHIKPDVILPIEDVNKWIKPDEIMREFNSYIDKPAIYYSSSSIQNEHDSFQSWIASLENGSEVSKDQIAKLEAVLLAKTEDLNTWRNYVEDFVTDYLKSYKRNSNSDKESIRPEMIHVLDERIHQHEENIKAFQSALNEWKKDQTKHDWRLIGLIVGIGAILLGLLLSLVRQKKRSDSLLMPTPVHNPRPVANREIVVRRKTTSILKKQSLENVIDNPAYLAIDCSDFCPTSAVRRVYIKSTCIKDIYNMYAEDLRNPENPKEDGCMVLGRWVHDKDNNEYYVSLEEVVLPGDDAVFSEYELNFGGKIKLKVSERLRKLRRETDLQYDMTCWVHSHPGLGVFFSNQDNTVHMQLKHPSHPHFLTAMVIDILTPDQELGIFTFKPDGSLNSKADLTKMYSLEDMYRWAIESERNSFKREDHFDTLAHSRQRDNACHGVHLSNSAIIDIDRLVVEHQNGMAGMVHGFVQQEGDRKEIAVITVSQQEQIPDNELVGCFIITKYCSIPTVRKTIEQYKGKMRFALVYSTADGLLTTIPIQGGNLMTDEAYYGEQKLEELKIWTRRRR